MTAPFVPMNITNQSGVKIVDIAGNEHDVKIVQRKSGFIACLTLTDELGKSAATADEAARQLLLVINSNHPKQFACMERTKQTQLLNWIRLHLRKGPRGNTKRWSSNDLKDVVSQAIGFNVNNGELKGAMLTAGLAPTNDCVEYDTNWSFILERNPHLWAFVWRLVCSQVGYENIDRFSSLSHSFQLWLSSCCIKRWMVFIATAGHVGSRLSYVVNSSPYSDEEQ